MTGALVLVGAACAADVAASVLVETFRLMVAAADAIARRLI